MNIAFYLVLPEITDLVLLFSRFLIAISTNSLDTELAPTMLMKVVFQCSTWSRFWTYRSMKSKLTTTVSGAQLGWDPVDKGPRPSCWSW